MFKSFNLSHIFSRTGNILVVFLIFGWAIFRLYAYGDPKLSIAGNDTETFIEGSKVPLFSKEMMTGRRLLTTNLIYKFFEPDNGYKILVNGSLETSRRVYQPGFDNIVVLQFLVSIISWSVLTYILAAQMNSTVSKTLTALVIPAFAYTPQIADWDSILMSESLTFSLFVLQLALLIYIVFKIYKNPTAKISAWMILWGVIYFFWANLRDTNNYAALVLVGLSILTLFVPSFRKNKKIISIAIFGLLLFTIGIVTFQQSERSLLSTINIYIGDIFPYPARVEYMQKQLGMPEPQTNEFYAWFEGNGVTAATRFIFAHPGYALEKLSRDFPDAFHQGTQTYFTIPDKKIFRQYLVSIGEGFHPQTITPFLISIVFLLTTLFAAIQGKIKTAPPWLWISAYILMVSTIAIVPTILGDTWALHRHTIFSIAMYRLSMWLCILILIDFSLSKTSQ